MNKKGGFISFLFILIIGIAIGGILICTVLFGFTTVVDFIVTKIDNLIGGVG